MTALLVEAAAGAVAAGISLVIGARPPRRLVPPPVANARGRMVPVTLGVALTAGVCGVHLPFVLALFVPGRGEEGRLAAAFVVATVLVFAAGLHDDRRPERVRGLRTHFAQVLRGKVTTGMLKAAAAAGAGAVWGVTEGARGWPLVIGVGVMAGSANFFNLLDVAPGRALKWGLVASVVLLAAAPGTAVAAAAGSSAAVFPPDVRERAMLGDSGSNVLGFVLGVGLFNRLDSAGLAWAFGVILVLHLLAETVTLSRIIREVPPLRWFDELGRLPAGA